MEQQYEDPSHTEELHRLSELARKETKKIQSVMSYEKNSPTLFGHVPASTPVAASAEASATGQAQQNSAEQDQNKKDIKHKAEEIGNSIAALVGILERKLSLRPTAPGLGNGSAGAETVAGDSEVIAPR